MKIRNPENPFQPHVEEDYTYSKELGTITTEELETPRNIFTFVKRSNRTVTTTLKKDLFEEEKRNAEALKIIQTIDPTTLIRYPTSNVAINRHLMGILCTLAKDVEMTNEEATEFNNAMTYLSTGISPMEGEDYLDFDSGDDI